MELADDIRKAFVDGGTKIVVTRSLRKLVRPAMKLGSLVFTECDLTKPFPEAKAVAGIILREGTIKDAPIFADPELARTRFRQGHRSFMGIEEKTGKLANYRWVNTSAAYIPELERYLILGPKDAYVYDLNTLPEFRRRGIDACTRHYTYSFLRDSGYTRIYAYIHGDNRASLQASRHLLRPIGRVWYLQPRGCVPIMLGGRGAGFPELRRLS
jgi:ribosomal protein S18 acetylase RimI-like enzyme